MTPPPVLLVSCTRCRRLHAPLRADAAHPVCAGCQPAAPSPGPVSGASRP